MVVPKGFGHDSYSVVPNLKGKRPAILHDYCYRYKCWHDGSRMTREEADDVLLEAMQASPDWLTRSLARVYWLGVRAFGWASW